MFFAQNEYGAQALRAAFDQLPIESNRRLKVTAKFLGIAESTLTAYLAGKSDPPRAVVYAVWHESELGRAVTSAHSEQGAKLWRSLAKSQAETIETLRARIDEQAAEIGRLKLARTSPARPMAANESFFERYR